MLDHLVAQLQHKGKIMHIKLEQELSTQKYKTQLDYSYILDSINNASDIVSPAWTLKSFVASNPLQGLEKYKFTDALQRAKEFFKTDIFSSDLNLEELLQSNNIDEDLMVRQVKQQLNWNQESLMFEGIKLSVSDFIRTSLLNSKPGFEELGIINRDFDIFIQSFYCELKDKVQSRVMPSHFYLYRSEKLVHVVSSNLIKYLEMYFDNDSAFFKMPGKEKGFYLSWKELAIYDDYKSKTKTKVINFINSLSSDPLEAIDRCIKDFKIDPNELENFFRTCFAHLPGWSSFIKWKIQYDTKDTNMDARIDFIELLAVRLCIKKIAFIEDPKINAYKVTESLDSKVRVYLKDFHKSLFLSGVSSKDIVSTDRNTLERLLEYYAELKNNKTILLLEMFESTFDEKFKAKIDLNLSDTKQAVRPKAQLVFCIDVRSEPFRKKLESINDYRTYGFAGFFGIPMRFQEFENETDCASCPVLIKPNHIVRETFVTKEGLSVLIRKEKNTTINNLKSAIKEVGENIASAYSFVEIAGVTYGVQSFLKTIMPKHFSRYMASIGERLNPKPNYEIDISSKKIDGREMGIARDDQYKYASQALKMIGLVDNFAPVVIFVGHGSSTINNAYASALDCGACGGNHGGPNARVLARILNRKFIRQKLLQMDHILIPEDTVFVGAQHNTTTDDFMFFEEHDSKIPKHLKEEIISDLKEVKNLNNKYRQNTFLTNDVPAKRAANWSETRPEWGLAKNACFIIGKRELTQNLDLESRAFLHSYDYSIDTDGSILETIMTAPMIVAQWINAQYLFSSVNNSIFGSGSKVTQNIFGKFAVCQGNASDLMHGLSMQSVHSSDTNLYHIPQRIINYIYAPRDRVEKIIKKHTVLQQLIYNSWIKLVIIDPHNNKFYNLF